jgi:putative nucleotidyltransferase with HDIG domain
VDTPSDYEAIQKRFSRYLIPTREECQAILRDIAYVDETIYEHCIAVADMAAKTSNVLNRAGCPIDHDQVIAAALLHDLAKGKPRHAEKAAELLNYMGFPEIADIVAKHTDIECSPFAPINCAEVLYLADKLVKGNQVIDIYERFQASLEKHGHDPEIKQKIEKRMHNAEIIQKKIAAIIGKSLRGG